MSIDRIEGISRFAGLDDLAHPSSAGGTARVAAQASGSETGRVAQPAIDPVTGELEPPRFPWISRLSLQLESAARQKSAFAPLPIIGEQVSHKV